MKALVGALNQEKALLGAFSVIVKTDCETDRFTGVFIMAGFSQGAIYKPDILWSFCCSWTISVVNM